MAFNLSLKIFPEILRSLSAASISGSPGTYLALKNGSTIGLLNPARIIILQNLTDQQINFSWDGVTDHMTLPSMGFILLDVTTNKTMTGGAFHVAEGQVIYAKATGSQPTTGNVYLTVLYGISV